MRFTTIFFDLDDTLYPSSTGLWQAIQERMNRYIHERLGLPQQEAPRLREEFFRRYGTTLRGLQAQYQVDANDFLAFVHDLPLQEYLKPDPVQRAVLASLPVRKVVFTNADVLHVRRVLAVLNLSDLFETIVDIHAIAPYCKPMPQAFQIAMEIAQEVDPARCAMIDDLPHTVRAARHVGMFGILYGHPGPHSDADATLQHWFHLLAILDGVCPG